MLAFLRYPALLVTHAFLLPLLRVADKEGKRKRLLRRASGRAHIRMASNAFGAYRPTERDILVCAFCRSGTNWALQMAHQVANRGQGEFEHIHDVVPWPDAPHARYAVPLDDDTGLRASPTGLRVIKTHLAWEHIPHDDRARYLAVYRDPKDVMVSSYHFMRDTVFGPLMPSVAGWLDFFLTDDFFFGSWAAHLAGFWRERSRDNVLLLSFEAMREDLPGHIRAVADFAGVDLAPAEFDKVLHLCTFETMKAMDRAFYPGGLTPLSSHTGSMIREGKSRASSDLLSPSQQQRIDAWAREALVRLDCDFPYDEVYGATGRGA